MAMAMMLMTVSEMAAILDAAETMPSDVSECLGGEVIRSSDLREAGHAALGVRFLSLPDDDQADFLSTVLELREAAAGHLVEGCEVLRLGGIDGAGRSHIALVFGRGLVVTISGGWCGLMTLAGRLTHEDLMELIPIPVGDSAALTVHRRTDAGWSVANLIGSHVPANQDDSSRLEWSRMVSTVADLSRT